jgi:hypothetical protein
MAAPAMGVEVWEIYLRFYTTTPLHPHSHLRLHPLFTTVRCTPGVSNDKNDKNDNEFRNYSNIIFSCGNLGNHCHFCHSCH